MSDSAILDVAIGLTFIYLLLSLICSALNEWIAALLRFRSRTLEKGIRNLLNNPDGDQPFKDFYGHPLIKALGQQKTGIFPERKPSYIESKTFSLVLMDILLSQDGGGEKAPPTIENLKTGIASLPDCGMKKSLLVLINNAGDNLENCKKNIEDWFDHTMDRVSGWYARKVQVVLFVLAVVVAVTLQADSLYMGQTLWHDESLRTSIVAAAEKRSDACIGDQSLKMCEGFDQANFITEHLSELPLGWTNVPDVNNFKEGVLRFLGIFITVIAVSLGAPFWFDILNRLIKIRAAGKKPIASTDGTK